MDLQPAPRFNLLVGPNGSGKTSALEAIHVLSVGRSFRTHKLDPLISTDSDQFLLYSELGEGQRLGLQRGRSGAPTLRLDSENQTSWSQVAALLPLQIINTDSFSLLEGGGKVRRQFLDWAMFHVEHSYLREWRGYRRLLSQRNSLLKQRPADLHQQLDAWDIEIARLAQSIHLRRQDLIQGFGPEFEELVATFLPAVQLELSYQAGWDLSQDISEALRQNRERDLRYGMTLLGPHRADFQVRVGRHPAIEVLSRGQTKMLVCAIKLAMGQLIKNRVHRSIYLIDDLAAELDLSNCKIVIDYLETTQDQCFFTAIQEDFLPVLAHLTESSGKFHVEHGKIRACHAGNRR